MPPLPRAMLIDLDDTILSAYANPGPLWLEVVTEFADELPGLQVLQVRDAILASGETFWDDPERHRIWRQQMYQARREVVRLGFEALTAGGAKDVSAAVKDAIADRFSSLREHRYTLFPGAIE